MAFMDWNEQLSVGVEALDADHKQLVGMINELYDGMLNNRNHEVLDGIFERLVDYTKMHFAREESLFDSTCYPDLARHKQKHEEMTAWVVETQRKYISGDLSAPAVQVAMGLKQWLFHHIIGTDDEYKDYFRKHGIH